MKIALMIALPTNKGFLFPPFPLPGLTTAPREQSSSARNLLWGCWERGSIPWERSGSKGARGCCSKVKWINLNWVHSRSWLFYFEKVSAHLFRLPLGLSSLNGSIGRAREGRGCTHAWLLAASFPATFSIRDSAWPTDTALLAAFVLQFWYVEQSIGNLPLALSLLQMRHKLTKRSLFVPILRLLIA